jgi:methyl-accepting chemotaxis protein
MARKVTVGRKIGLGFALVTAVTLVVAVSAGYALRATVAAKDQVLDVYARNLIEAGTLTAAIGEKMTSVRFLVLTGEARFVDELEEQHAVIAGILEKLKKDVRSDQERAVVAEIERREREHQAELEVVFDLRQKGATKEVVLRQFEEKVVPTATLLEQEDQRFAEREAELLAVGKREASKKASLAVTAILAIAALGVFIALLLAVVVARGISRQIGTSVAHMQSSSSELQSAANQQAAGAREQSAAITETSTTLRELAATSRQMAESAQRVTRIADDTAGAARGGDKTVERAQEAISAIKRQVDLIVTHMLDLGRKSQQVGNVLELINELAEQTNILAINATIESAGAGEAGRGFAVVADEIRKLADRVAGSTKEIRALVDEIRAAANTTVMATEDGAKAVDVGTRQFLEVATALRQIVTMAESTTEASREIELGSKQQATAVEQVNAALVSVAQAAKESETTTKQTLDTSVQLASVSRSLLALVQPDTAGGHG